MQRITIEKYLALAQTAPVLDVRSPAEYKQAHIPGAYHLPLFSDDERKEVGTAYKKQGRETAIKIGLDLFGPKMRAMVEEAGEIIKNYELTIKNDGSACGNEGFSDSETTSNIKKSTEPVTRNSSTVTNKNILIYCARGGMRSAAVSWLLDLYGFSIFTLAGGYKKYRGWVLQHFERPYNFHIIGGYTGSGKTPLLQKLAAEGRAVIDLEALASHKGSALGGLGKGTQPRQEMFENFIAEKLSVFHNATMIFLEDESQRIGDLQIPMPLWRTIRRCPVFFFDIPFEKRLDHVTAEYSLQGKAKLISAVVRIQKRLGGLETKNAVGFLLEENYRDGFAILLRYYDKYYLKGLHNRENAAALITTISSGTVDAAGNYNLLNNCLIKTGNAVSR